MTKEPTVNYRELSAELDEILSSLQTDDLDIDEAMAKYERGTKLVQQLEDHLKTAENKIVKLKKAGAN
jgi:exodeoxyribonuclease VII small subunit